ncbi:hypothetical protein [Sphingomonas sp. R86521]|uniref:hypothetical protein n=1 Tax=Sphingomonas sp. R86521 TaxID=3093860 RepID=UPI0036D284CC
MFDFQLEPEIPLLTVTRSGSWSVDTMMAYEPLLRRELALLEISGRPRCCILDIRSTTAPAHDVGAALRAMVARLGHLRPDRIAVVSSSGIRELRAQRTASPDYRIFASMRLAREWITEASAMRLGTTIHDQPSRVEPEGLTVHVRGPSNVDIILTPAAALETAKRMGDAAVDVILESVKLVSGPQVAA